MLVRFNDKRLKMIPVRKGAPQLRLLPGINEVPDEVWNLVRPLLSNELARHDSKPARLVEIGAKKEAKGFVGKRLRDFEPSKAEELIADTWDVQLLEKFKGEETRESVRLATMNQLDLIRKPADSDKQHGATRPDVALGD